MISTLLTPGDKRVNLFGFLFKDRKIQFLKCKADACTRVVPKLYTCINIIILNSFKIMCYFQNCLNFSDDIFSMRGHLLFTSWIFKMQSISFFLVVTIGVLSFTIVIFSTKLLIC